jgi:hypothetical protein
MVRGALRIHLFGICILQVHDKKGKAIGGLEFYGDHVQISRLLIFGKGIFLLEGEEPMDDTGLEGLEPEDLLILKQFTDNEIDDLPTQLQADLLELGSPRDHTVPTGVEPATQTNGSLTGCARNSKT